MDNKIIVFSEKEQEYIEFDLNGENLNQESYECVGMSNADYGS